jgi:hypothetical protein
MFDTNRVALFFVWLKSRIEQSCSILCSVGEPYKCRRKERGESAVSERALASGCFYEARAFQLFIVNFYIEIQKPLHSYFVGN